DLAVDEDLRGGPATRTRDHGVPSGRVTTHGNFMDLYPFVLEQSLCPVTPGSLWLGIHLNIGWHAYSPASATANVSRTLSASAVVSIIVRRLTRIADSGR